MKIKNKFWLPVLFVMFVTSVQAGNHVHFMLFGGFNSSKTITNLNNRHKIISEAKQNFNFGAGFRFEFGLLLIQPEVYFTRKGGLADSFRPNLTDSFGHQVNMQSLDLPVMVGLNLFHSNNFCFRLYGGPVISVLSDHNIEISKNGQLIPWSARTRAFSMQFGTGFDIRRFTFDVRYELALSPMLRFSDFRTSHRILYFTLGLKLF